MTKQLLSAATGNTTSPATNRTQSFVVSGIFHYKKTGSGACILRLHNLLGAEVAALEVPATNPASGRIEVAIPAGYQAVITDADGSFSLDAFMDGDA